MKIEFKLSRKPFRANPSCASCGKVFKDDGVNLQLLIDKQPIDFSVCQPCLAMAPFLEATVNLEQGFARLKR